MLGSRTRYHEERAEVVHVGLTVETEDGNGEFRDLKLFGSSEEPKHESSDLYL